MKRSGCYPILIQGVYANLKTRTYPWWDSAIAINIKLFFATLYSASLLSENERYEFWGPLQSLYPLLHSGRPECYHQHQRTVASTNNIHKQPNLCAFSCQTRASLGSCSDYHHSLHYSKYSRAEVLLFEIPVYVMLQLSRSECYLSQSSENIWYLLSTYTMGLLERTLVKRQKYFF